MNKNIFLLLICGGIIFQSCFHREKKIDIVASDAMIVDTTGGSCPFLTSDNNGNLVLSWIRKINDSTYKYCYAISDDKGKSFRKAIEIPGSGNIHPHGENLPKIIFKPDGEIIAAWASANPNAKNAYSDIVYYARSTDGGSTWSDAAKLVTDTAGYDQRYFDMALLPNGNVGIIWLDNRKTKPGEGSAMYFAETSGSSGFQNGHLLSEPCCPCCRTDLFVDSKKNIHVLYRAIINNSIRDMVHSVSKDMGKTFSKLERISDDNWVINGCPHTGPAMTENKDGIQFTWFTGGRNAGIYYCSSNNNGKTFSDRQMVSGPDARHCQITSVDDAIAIVWNENYAREKFSYSMIGLEIRKENGSKPLWQFITPQSGYASYPVIKAIDKNSVLVAYTETIKDKDFVKYRIVNL